MKSVRLRWRMLAMLLCSLAVIWGAALYEIDRGRQRALNEAHVAVRFQSHLFAENAKSLFKRLDEVMFDLRVHWDEGDRNFTSQVQRQILHISDIAFQIGVIGPDGLLAYSNLKRAAERVDLSERAHFKVHKEGGADSLFISKPLKGKVSGRWTVQFTRPIYNGARFDGVIVLSVAPETLVQFHEQLNLEGDPALAVIALDGDLMARYPDNDAHMGKMVSGTPYQAAGAPVSGSFTRHGQVDGVERIYGYYRLAEYGLAFVVGKSVPSVLAQRKPQTDFILLAALLVSFGVGTLILFLHRSQSERSKALDDLHQSEERFKRLADLTLVGIIIHDGEKILDVNPVFCQQFGYAREELVGNRFDFLLTSGSIVQARQRIDERCEEPYEAEVRRKDGSAFPVEIRGRNVVYDGIPVRVASVYDISQRKLDEERLRQSEERYHNLFSGSKTPMLLIDPEDGTIVDANLAASSFYGYSESDLRKLKIGDINTATKVEVAQEMARAKADQRSYFHFRHRLASGEIRDVEVHSGPIHLQGRVILYSLIHDETERVRLERERRKLIRAVEQSPVSIVITNKEGVIEYVNPRFVEVTGYAEEEVVGKNPKILKSGKTPPETYESLWASISKGEEWHGELCNRKKNGELYWEQASISCIMDANGDITHYLGVKEDVTERRAIAQELKRSHAELEQFAYVASHDLRQPLRMVASYLQLIQRKLGPGIEGDLAEFMGFAIDGAKRMDKLIISLLEYSRVGRNAEPAAPVELDEILRESRLNLEVAINEAGASIEIAPGLPTIQGHWTELVRLFQNLIGNAVKYRSPERSPKIAITARRDEGEWVIEVADNGMGIDPKDHQRAFAIFQRLVSAKEYEGTGIGLAVCKKIVEHHKGRIWIESELGKGSRFYVAFPAFDA